MRERKLDVHLGQMIGAVVAALPRRLMPRLDDGGEARGRSPQYHDGRGSLPAPKEELPPKRISAFINEAVRARLFPDRRNLDAAYRAARRERWRKRLAEDWKHTDAEGWPA